MIVPMTLVDANYFDEVVGGLRDEGIDVRHFALTASVEVIHRRLRSRLAVLTRDVRYGVRRVDVT